MSTTINLNNIYKLDTFNSIFSILENAESTISFLGKRGIRVAGYKNTISLYSFTRYHVHLIIKKNYEYSDDERLYGNRISIKILSLFEESNVVSEKCNFLTKFLIKVRDLADNIIFGTKSNFFCNENYIGYHHGYSKIFNFYTFHQYREKFGTIPKKWDDYFPPGNYQGPTLIKNFDQPQEEKSSIIPSKEVAYEEVIDGVKHTGVIRYLPWKILKLNKK